VHGVPFTKGLQWVVSCGLQLQSFAPAVVDYLGCCSYISGSTQLPWQDRLAGSYADCSCNGEFLCEDAAEKENMLDSVSGLSRGVHEMICHCGCEVMQKLQHAS